MARNFNGTSDLITVPAVSNALDISSGPMTVSLWMYPTSVGTEHDPMAKWGASGPGQNFLIALGSPSLSAANQLGFVVGRLAPITGVFGAIATAITANAWYQVTLAVDANAKYSGSPVAIFSLAGAASGSNVQAFRENRTAGGVNLNIGGQQVTIPTFAGRVAQAAMWNTVLSTYEVGALQAGVSPSRIRPQSLVGFWPLYGTSSPEDDLSGHAYNGTLTGTTVATQPPGTAY